MKMIRNVLLSVVVSALCATAALAQIPPDVVTIGTVSSSSSTVDVPVYIRDTAGTPLGIDQPAGSRIQSYSLQVLYASPAVQSITFTRGGITSSLTPTFESSPAAPGTSIALLDTFDETTNLIPFTSNAALPGNQVATLHVTIAAGTPAGTVIAFTLDPTLTQLTDEGGTPGTVETTGNGRLALVAGSITVTEAVIAPAVPTLSTWAMALMALLIAAMATRLRMS
ncbi:MAG TPA: IPTL-CTERM sorting domain-containing protein [Thermoanaerobaculia bacterium]|nr:IPTL-CTERM sorting domain-containing protein [Thermoanaerobaculia bacterium]